MKIYSAHGVKDFIVCLGYKGHMIKEFFANYSLNMSDVTFDLSKSKIEVHANSAEDWRVSLVDTGESTMTGGRLARVMHHLDDDFCLTYGDGVADIDIGASIQFHKQHGRLATVAAVYPPRRFGILDLQDNRVTAFHEKPIGEGGFINGGFFILSRDIASQLKGDDTIWEREPLETLAKQGDLYAYRHEGFFHAMDTLRDRQYLEELWASNRAPWKVW
jgi:glucose-1-phosphate cytidylyltransferase